MNEAVEAIIDTEKKKAAFKIGESIPLCMRETRAKRRGGPESQLKCRHFTNGATESIVSRQNKGRKLEITERGPNGLSTYNNTRRTSTNPADWLKFQIIFCQLPKH